MKLVVIDGLGGGLGAQIISSIEKVLNDSVEIIALGSNSAATARMINQGADRGATGENAIKFTVKKADIIIGPIGIIVPNSMSGEITPAMAEAVASVTAKKYLIGIKQPHFNLVGLTDDSINEMIDDLVEQLKDNIAEKYLLS